MAPMKIAQERQAYLQERAQTRFEEREKYGGYMPPRGYMPPYGDPYAPEPLYPSSKQGQEWGY